MATSMRSVLLHGEGFIIYLSSVSGVLKWKTVDGANREFEKRAFAPSWGELVFLRWGEAIRHIQFAP